MAFIKVDNGSDWSIRSVVNSLYLCRLWRDAGLDILDVVSYAAKYSAYNQIKHLWSPMSKKLSSVILPSVLEEEDSPPYLQNNLSKDELKLKEAAVFDNAMTLIKDVYWKNAMFNENEVTTLVKQSLTKESPYEDYEHVHQVWSNLFIKTHVLNILPYFNYPLFVFRSLLAQWHNSVAARKWFPSLGLCQNILIENQMKLFLLNVLTHHVQTAQRSQFKQSKSGTF